MSGGALAAPLLASSAGDFLLEWDRQRLFVAGLGAFLLAHLPVHHAVPTRMGRAAGRGPGCGSAGHGPSSPRIAASVVIAAAGLALTAWLWPGLGDLRLPVAAYIGVLLAMAVAAQLARLDTLLVAVVPCCLSRPTR